MKLTKFGSVILLLSFSAMIGTAGKPTPPPPTLDWICVDGDGSGLGACKAGMVHFTGTGYPRLVTVHAVFAGEDFDRKGYTTAKGFLDFTESMGGVGDWLITVVNNKGTVLASQSIVIEGQP